jgi:hypothetical protein
MSAADMAIRIMARMPKEDSRDGEKRDSPCLRTANR